MRTGVLLLLAAAVPALAEIYGKYCGPGHTNAYGAEPLDRLDRVCQIHDICVGAAGMGSCFCNEQLLMGLMAFDPVTDEQLAYRSYAINAISLALHVCLANLVHLPDRYLVGTYPSAGDTRGFTYLTFYSYSDSAPLCLQVSEPVGVRAATMERSVYWNHFVWAAHDVPQAPLAGLDPATYQEIALGGGPEVCVLPGTVLVFAYSGVGTEARIRVLENGRRADELAAASLAYHASWLACRASADDQKMTCATALNSSELAWSARYNVSEQKRSECMSALAECPSRYTEAAWMTVLKGAAGAGLTVLVVFLPWLALRLCARRKRGATLIRQTEDASELVSEASLVKRDAVAGAAAPPDRELIAIATPSTDGPHVALDPIGTHPGGSAPVAAAM